MRQSGEETMNTFLRCRVDKFCPMSSGVDAAGDGRRRRVEQLLLHVGLFHKCARCSQQHDTVEHLQGDHPARTYRNETHSYIVERNAGATLIAVNVLVIDIYPR